MLSILNDLVDKETVTVEDKEKNSFVFDATHIILFFRSGW